jgi:hypothetical protein
MGVETYRKKTAQKYDAVQWLGGETGVTPAQLNAAGVIVQPDLTFFEDGAIVLSTGKRIEVHDWIVRWTSDGVTQITAVDPATFEAEFELDT